MSRMSDQHLAVLSEADLVARLTAWLMADGYRVRTEVANMGQSADVVALRGRWATIIEAKLKDWRRAVEQCQAHEVIADYVCIAIALVTVPDGLVAVAQTRGYGIIHFDGAANAFCWAVLPRRNRKIWAPQRECWSRTLREVALCQ